MYLYAYVSANNIDFTLQINKASSDVILKQTPKSLIFIIMEKNFVRAHSALDLTISISLIAGGATLVSLPTSQSVNVLGFFLMTAGLILLFIYKSGYKDNESGERYTKKEHFFAQSERSRILEAVENNKMRDIDYADEDKGNGLRLDIYINSKKSKAFVQVFEYIPYKYEPCSDQYELECKEF